MRWCDEGVIEREFSRTRGMSKAVRQMLAKAERVGEAHGEAVRDLISDEASGPPREHPHTASAKPKAGTGGLLEAALTRENLQRA